MNATDMVQGNLALKLETPAAPVFTVVKGGRSGFQTLPGKPSRSQRVTTASAPAALKASTIVALAVALTLFFVLATSIFSRICRVGIQRYLRDSPCSAWRFLVVACPGASD